jgi:nucleoid-associated protein YgaU
MPRLLHGSIVTPAALQDAQRDLARLSADIDLGFAVASPSDVQDFDFLFPSLQGDPANLLPESPDTPEQLKVLGRTMEDSGGPDPGDADIPAVYTYFGQFVDHDITLEVQPADLPPSFSGSMAVLLDPNMTPLPLVQIRNVIQNFRTATLDLDSVYGLPAPRDPANGAKLLTGVVAPLEEPDFPEAKPFLRPPDKGDDNDLPREPRSGNSLHDRAALIGDPRNDENLIVAQLHLAFLKAHNALVDQGRTFEEARRLLRQHYQFIVVHDFLKRVVDPGIVDGILQQGNRWYNALAEPFFLPLEFAVACYRFGHTMVRDIYDFNLNFNTSGEQGTTPATLGLLFTFTALSGQVGPGAGFDTLPENWIIEWERFVDTGSGAVNKARRLDTKLASPGLFALPNLEGQTEAPEDAARLAVRNLLRGYRLRLPTGQAIARFLGLPALTPAEIEAAAASAAQADALRAAGFLERTPLWFYLLAEAKHGGGQRLGPVGGTIVAEVLIGLVRRSPDSFLSYPGWVPSLPSARPGRFELADLLRFAGVLAGGSPPRIYTVRPGDTLSGIARDQLGDARRWPEIFVVNRAIIRHPDRIFPGQVLTLPGDAPMDPPPRIYVVQPGDTLSGIARQQLGDAGRWPEIFALNRDVIADPDRIFPDQVLILPI